MRFVLEFDMNNAAFEDDPTGEVLRVLSVVEDQIEAGYGYGPLRDVNGNTIGDWKISHSSEVLA